MSFETSILGKEMYSVDVSWRKRGQEAWIVWTTELTKSKSISMAEGLHGLKKSMNDHVAGGLLAFLGLMKDGGLLLYFRPFLRRPAYLYSSKDLSIAEHMPQIDERQLRDIC